jgi:hypothetical protein
MNKSTNWLHWIQNVLSLTPFVRPRLARFLDNADKKGLLGRYPLIGNAIAVIAPLKWLDNKLKYPILTIGRLVLSLALVVLCVNLTTYNESYKSLVNTKVVSQLAPDPKPVTTAPYDGRISMPDYISNVTKEQFRFTTESITVALKKSAITESLYGSIGALPRGLLFYILWSLLFLVLGNTISQREQRAFEINRPYREIGKVFMDNFQVFNAYIQSDTNIPQTLKDSINNNSTSSLPPISQLELNQVIEIKTKTS